MYICNDCDNQFDEPRAVKEIHDEILIKCDKCGHEYHEISMTHCPHPAVNRRYGKSLCVYYCKKCRYSKYVGIGWACTYKKSISKEA